MAVSGVNSNLNPFPQLSKNRTVNLPTPKTETALNITKITDQKNKPAETLNMKNKENSDLVKEKLQNQTPQVQPKEQANVKTQINNVQKMPNGMDQVAQGIIQGYKGVNRLA